MIKQRESEVEFYKSASVKLAAEVTRRKQIELKKTA